ncbi:MAG TPA: RagB/SusD family nutrient uptake outer membrane protein, partial [Haliscomenobacter sp.]|nr:RagB/SusD family nutrient uptake outer membrane protein [Haliscomenobacter sp.]
CALYQVNTKFEEEFASANNIAQGKWSRYFLAAPQGQNSAKGTGINWPMLRYADVLLMYAEAENELNGPTLEAKNAFKRVRQRAFSSSLWGEKVDAYTDSRSGSKEDFFNAIVDERGWEFGGEMIRKYELIRWGIYSKKMQEIVNIQKQMVDDALAGTGKYANLPDYMYWKRNAAGKFIVLNPNTKVAGVPDPSWTRVPFTRAMYDATKMTYSEFVTKDWEPYYNGPVPGVARYIFPVPEEAVSASQGKVDNKGYMFK